MTRSPKTGTRIAGQSPPKDRSIRAPHGDNAVVAVMAAFLGVVFLIPTRLTFLPLGNAGRPAVIVGVMLLILWMLSLLMTRGLPPGRQPVRWLVLGYLTIEVIGFTTGYGRGLVELESNSADRSMIVRLSMAGVVLFFADGPRSRRQIDYLIGIILALGALVAVVGVIQFFVGFDLQQYIRIPGLSPLIDLVEIRQRGTGGAVSRVAGLSTHYIEYGVVLGMVTPVAIHFALFARDPFQSLVRWGAVAAIVVAIPMSVSRSGILALAVGMLVMATVWSWRLRYNALVIGVVAMALFRAVAPGVLGTLQALFLNFGNDPSVEGRTDDYAIVFPMIYDRPFMGRGVGTFLPERYIVLDNQVLYTLVSSGIVGLIGFLGLFFGAMGLARSIRRRARAAEDRHLAQALCASIAAGFVASFTFDALGFVQFRSVLCVLLGLVGALWRLSGTRVADPVVTEQDPRGRVMRPLWEDLACARRGPGTAGIPLRRG